MRLLLCTFLNFKNYATTSEYYSCLQEMWGYWWVFFFVLKLSVPIYLSIFFILSLRNAQLLRSISLSFGNARLFLSIFLVFDKLTATSGYISRFHKSYGHFWIYIYCLEEIRCYFWDYSLVLRNMRLRLSISLVFQKGAPTSEYIPFLWKIGKNFAVYFFSWRTMRLLLSIFVVLKNIVLNVQLLPNI